MGYRIVEDSELAKRNRSLLVCGGAGAAYNAVLDKLFSGENATEPVTIDEAKDWIRVSSDISDDDIIIGKVIQASRARLEISSNVSFITRTVSARLLNGLGGITLPYGPVNTVTSVVDGDGTAISTGDYELRGVAFKQLHKPLGEVTIVYTAGYSTLPQDMREDLLNQIAYAYENRGDVPKASKISPLVKLAYSQR